MTKNFGLIGAAGYIAPRHMQAIKDTGNNLTVAMDKFDSVGILDSYFPETSFFTEFERFDRHLNKLIHSDSSKKIDFMSICTPNYLHDSHIAYALRLGVDAICEKPLVVNPWNLDSLEQLSKETGRNVYNILQLRLHPSLIALKKEIDSAPKDKIFDVDLAYLTSRGIWYHHSWKGDDTKSGGVTTNIGVHFFDMLGWIFGELTGSKVHIANNSTMAGFLEFKRARVRWLLSIDAGMLPKEIAEKGQRTYRSITVEGKEVEFSSGFTDLHTQSYQEILRGNGFGTSEARQAVETVYKIRSAKPIGLVGDYHPLAKQAKISAKEEEII